MGMKVKGWRIMLKKETFNELRTGWLSPDGDFYPTGYMEHLAVADEIWSSIYNNSPPNDVDRRLVKLGWCDIKYLTFLEHGFLFNFERHLTPEQKSVIQPVFENNKPFVIDSSRMDLEEEFY